MISGQANRRFIQRSRKLVPIFFGDIFEDVWDGEERKPAFAQPVTIGAK